MLRENEWKLICQYADDTYQLYNLPADIGEQNDLAAANADRVLAMAMKMQAALIGAGAQWPTLQASGAEDPFQLPQ